MSIPFHKQTDPNKQAGQVVFSPVAPNTQQELTLSDYIERKTDEPKRITFDEWLEDFYPYSERPDPQAQGSYTFITALKEAWNDALTKGKI